MSHPENQSTTALAVQQIELLLRESFRMAERVIRERMDTMGLRDDRAKDQYQGLTPMVAVDIMRQLHGVVGIEQANQRQVEEGQASLASIIAELKKRNDSAEKQA